MNARSLPLFTLTLCLGALSVVAAACDSTQELVFDEPNRADGSADEDARTADAANIDANDDANDAGVDTGVDADAGTPRADFDASDEPVNCAGTGPCATRLAAGERHVCARMNDGSVVCWGDNTKGSVGAAAALDGGSDASTDGGLGAGTAPRTVANLADVTQISAADDTTCARLSNGAVACWGANTTGQLGMTPDPATKDALAHPTPTTVTLGGGARRVDVGHGSVCAVLENDALWCWGQNAQGQLLRAGSPAVGGPGLVDVGAVALKETTAGNSTIYGLGSAGDVVSWGMVSGRDTSYPIDPAPHTIEALDAVVSLATSVSQVDATTNTAKFHTCAVTGGRVYCWGARIGTDIPALCTGIPNDEKTPTFAPTQGRAYPQQVAVARYTTCARMTDGTVQCCGDDSRGQMGTGAVAKNPAVLGFTPASALVDHAVQVVTSQFATCALLVDGTVACWGGNQYGELGQGTVDAQPHPTPVKVIF